jgi:thioesterase domain-containing protein/acyl carrier protein
LGEIESVVRRRGDVREAVVTVWDDLPGGKQLVGYVVAEGDVPPSADELRESLGQVLPDYMIPPTFIVLEAIPLTPNGKVDYRALPRPEHAEAAPCEYVAPRTAEEQQLADIWCELLHLERVGIHDNFFALGGHSLLAVRMVVQVRATLGVELRVAAVFAAPTIAKMAECIEAARRGETIDRLHETQMVEEIAASLLGRSTSDGHSLVPLRKDGSAPPLFCIHGLGGHVAVFLPLARGLPTGRPVYGLQGLGLDVGQQPHRRIEEMAAFYLQEIQSVQPHGPYRLAGWSMGGLIALEMAQQLAARGERVALLAMFDTQLSIVHYQKLATDEQSVVRWVAPLVNLSASELKKLPLDQQWEQIAEKANLAGGIGVPEIRRLAEVCKAHLAACASYRPQPYQGPVVLFPANQGRAGRRWKSLFPHLRVEPVPGNHYSMLRKPAVEVLIERLGRYLADEVDAAEKVSSR